MFQGKPATVGGKRSRRFGSHGGSVEVVGRGCQFAIVIGWFGFFQMVSYYLIAQPRVRLLRQLPPTAAPGRLL